MFILEANKLEKHFGDRLIFKVDNLKLYSKDRIGIVGLNGAGKTTLLKVLSKEEPPEKGIVTVNGNVALIEQLSEEESIDASNRAKSEWDVKELERTTMSGGELTRLKIAKALEQKAHILFADEPTSHLDLSGIEMIEQALIAYDGAVVLISHDRELLDRVCTKMLEVENGVVTEYVGNYSEYRKQKQRKQAHAQFEYEQYVKEKDRLTKAASEKSEKAKSVTKKPRGMSDSEVKVAKYSKNAKQLKVAQKAKAIEKRIEMLEHKEKPKEFETVKFDLAYHSPLHSKIAISAERISKVYGNRTLYENVTFAVKPGMKVALVGPNGSGKSTLMKMMLSGDTGFRISSACKIGYFSQNLSLLNEEKTILANVMENSRYPETMVRTVLARLLFKREEVYKPVSVLSGGERVKVALAKVFLGEYNVLMLDEPTNYLDIFTQEEIENVLLEYPGTILVATHDRRLMNDVVDHVLVFENKSVRLFQGSFDQYLAKQNMSEARSDSSEALMVLEMEMTDILARLAMPKKGDAKDVLEKRYTVLLQEIRKLKNNSVVS